MNQGGEETLEDWFDRALDVPESERAAWLERVCDERPGLGERLRALLMAHEKNARDGRVKPLPIREPGEETPLSIGEYRVTGPIGEGGVGAVFDARHTVTGRRAAVKLIRAGFATGRQKLRFQLEAETLGRLNHPAIAHLYEAGVADVTYAGGGGTGAVGGRRPFIAMEFVDGELLTEWARQRGLDVRDRVRLVAEAAHAVEHAHQRGVVHRDIKPGNLMVTSEGRVKVVDFGIARLLEGAEGGTLTMEGTTAGTPAFMSPEQLLGRGDEIDLPTDVYGLGATLYCLLTGRAPLRSTSLLTPAEVARLLASEVPPVRSVASGVDADLAAVVHKALEKRPSDRYDTAASFVADLERWLSGKPTVARPLGRWARAVKYARRNKWKSVAVGMTGVAAVAMLAGVGLVARSVGAERAALADQREALRFMNDMLVRVSPDSAGALGPDRKLSDLVIAAERDIARSDVGPRVKASVHLSLARINLGLARLDSAEANAKSSISLLDALEDDSVVSVEAKETLAQVYVERTRNVEAAALWWEAWRWRVRHHGRDNPDTLRTASELTLAELNANRPHGTAVPSFETTLAALEAAKLRAGAAWTAENEAALIRAWEIRAHLHVELLDKQVELGDVLDRAISAAAALHGIDHPVTVRLERIKGVGLLRSGDFRGAGEVLRPVRARLAARLGESHTHVLHVDTMIGDVLRETGDPAAALALHTRVLPLLRANLGDRHYQVVEMAGHVAMDLHRLGRTDEAEAMLRRTLDDTRGIQPTYRWVRRWLHRELARVLLDRGNPVEAARILRVETFEGGEPLPGDDNAGGELANWFLDYAEALEKLGERGKARTAAETARLSMLRAYGPLAPHSRRAEAIWGRLK